MRNLLFFSFLPLQTEVSICFKLIDNNKHVWKQCRENKISRHYGVGHGSVSCTPFSLLIKVNLWIYEKPKFLVCEVNLVDSIFWCTADLKCRRRFFFVKPILRVWITFTKRYILHQIISYTSKTRLSKSKIFCAPNLFVGKFCASKRV